MIWFAIGAAFTSFVIALFHSSERMERFSQLNSIFWILVAILVTLMEKA